MRTEIKTATKVATILFLAHSLQSPSNILAQPTIFDTPTIITPEKGNYETVVFGSIDNPIKDPTELGRINDLANQNHEKETLDPAKRYMELYIDAQVAKNYIQYAKRNHTPSAKLATDEGIVLDWIQKPVDVMNQMLKDAELPTEVIIKRIVFLSPSFRKYADNFCWDRYANNSLTTCESSLESTQLDVDSRWYINYNYWEDEEFYYDHKNDLPIWPPHEWFHDLYYLPDRYINYFRLRDPQFQNKLPATALLYAPDQNSVMVDMRGKIDPFSKALIRMDLQDKIAGRDGQTFFNIRSVKDFTSALNLEGKIRLTDPNGNPLTNWEYSLTTIDRPGRYKYDDFDPKLTKIVKEGNLDNDGILGLDRWPFDETNPMIILTLESPDGTKYSHILTQEPFLMYRIDGHQTSEINFNMQLFDYRPDRDIKIYDQSDKEVLEGQKIFTFTDQKGKKL